MADAKNVIGSPLYTDWDSKERTPRCRKPPHGLQSKLLVSPLITPIRFWVASVAIDPRIGMGCY